MKAARGVSDPQRIGASVDQLAFDSIAELFARHDDGRFHVLERYFVRLGPLAHLSDDQLIAFLRRLIFSAVNNHRYRTFREFEPWLGRISRNIKLTLKDHKSLMLAKRHGFPSVALRNGPKEREGLPELPSEFLQAEFFAAGVHESTLRRMLDAVAEILRAQHAYAVSLPLVQVTELVHTAYLAQRPVESDMVEDSSIADGELRLLISRVVNTLKVGKIAGYVRKGKIPQSDVGAYCATLTEILELTFLSNNGDGQTYYSVFRNHMPGVGSRTYRGTHRPILEYLAKTAKSAMRSKLLVEFRFPQGGRLAPKVGVGATHD